MTKTIFVILVLLGFGISKDIGPKYGYSIGFGAGMVGGFGISIEKILNDKHSIRINFAPFYIEDKYPEDSKSYQYNSRDSGYSNRGFISLGVIYHNALIKTNNFSFEPFFGTNFMGIYKDQDYYESSYSYVGNSEVIRHVNTYNEQNILSIGGGIGATFRFWRIKLSLFPGFVAGFDFVDKSKAVTPSIDAGIHLLF